MSPTLTPEQLAALQRFAQQNGRTWKSTLLRAWCDGRYPPYEMNISHLQTIRNTHGPSWLVRFRLPRS